MVVATTKMGDAGDRDDELAAGDAQEAAGGVRRDQICTDMLLNPMVVGDSAFVFRLSGPRGLPGRNRTNAPSSSRAGGDSDGLSTADGVKIKLPGQGPAQQHLPGTRGPIHPLLRRTWLRTALAPPHGTNLEGTSLALIDIPQSPELCTHRKNWELPSDQSANLQ